MTRAVVVGGGIAGLAVARRLQAAGLEVTVLEASGRWGGKLAPVEVDGLRLDGGAESMLARRPEAVGLATELGLVPVHPTRARPQILSRGAGVPIPPSVLGVPTDVDALSGLLSSAGLELSRREPDVPAPPLTDDVSIGDLVAARLGPEVVDRLLEPMLGGVYAGRARDLSFAAVAPALFSRAQAGGSLVGHARGLADAAPGGPVFAGLPGGVNALVAACVADLDARGASLLLGSTVRAIEGVGTRWRLTLGPVPGARVVEANAVILAVPAAPAARLLEPEVRVAARLAGVPYASTAVVTLLVRELRAEGSGLLVAAGELPTVKALTYSSNKWDWVRDHSGDTAVVRASVGRVGEDHLLQLPDADLVARTYAELAGLPGWDRTTLVAGTVTRWGGSLPQYLVGHVGLVAELRAELAGLPGLAVCGAAYDGVGIAACIGSADAAVAKITADLSAGEGGWQT